LYEDGLEIMGILDQYDAAERHLLLGAVLTIEFGTLLSYASVAERNADVDGLFNHVRERLAASDRRKPDQALH
jgi:hypothetical protein